VSLICVFAGLLVLSELLTLLQTVAAVLGWGGIDLLVAFDPWLSGVLSVTSPVARGLISTVCGLGSLVWRLVLYVAVAFVFAAYMGWVRVLWRAGSQRL
jgi:hypothetical protein